MDGSFKDYWKENRDAILKAAIMGAVIIIAAVLIITLVFHGLGGKSTGEESSTPDTLPAAKEQTGSEAGEEAREEKEEYVPVTREGGALYMVTDYTGLYSEIPDDVSSAYPDALAYGGEYYSSYADMKEGELTEGKFVPVVYQDRTMYLPAQYAQKVVGAKILPTSAIGQLGGSYYAYTGSGAAAAAILAVSEKGADWDKDRLIEFCSSYGYDDLGSMLTLDGGMSAESVINMIRDYSGGEYIAENRFSIDNVNTLQDLIDQGHRVMTSVRYAADIGLTDTDINYLTGSTTATQLIVVCGYSTEGGETYFYYADPYYYTGGEGLKKVSSSFLESTIDAVDNDRTAMIVLK
ncbi:MAG: hypothetical protein IJ806_08915 [Ruminococcus sp.]|nr:hypothetical protein [Ruminococcus sp.]